MKATEIKAKELVERMFYTNLKMTKNEAIKHCMFFVTETINFNKEYIEKSFGDEVNDIVIAINNTNKYWQQVLTHLKEM